MNDMGRLKEAMGGKTKKLQDADTFVLGAEFRDLSRGLFRGKTISGARLMQLMERRSPQDIVRLNYIFQFVTGSLGECGFDPLTPEDPLEDPSRYVDGIANAAYVANREETNRLSLNIKVNDLTKASVRFFVKMDEEIGSLFGSCKRADEYEAFKKSVVSAVSARFEELAVPGSPSVQICRYGVSAGELNELERTIRENEDRIHLVHGHAGTGKSTYVAREVANRPEDKTLVVSLSNTICLMMVDKLKRNGVKSVGFSSITKCRYSSPRGYDAVVVDEFSQWSFAETGLLKKLVEDNPKANVWLMGDVDQIPTFLSSGSLLYSMMSRFPEIVKRMETQYRFVGKLRTDIENLRNREYTFDLHDKSEITDGELARDASIIICGANASVDEMNSLMFRKRTGVALGDGEKLSNKLHAAPNGSRIPIICTATNTFLQDGKNVRIYSNERFTYVGGDRFATSDVSGERISIDHQAFNFCFRLGFAITVNKAQGLEWDNAIVLISRRDANMLNFQALYVAMSRGRISTLVATDGFSNSDLTFFLGKSTKYFDNFEEASM